MKTFFLRRSLTECALITAFAASGLLLAGAHLFENIGGFPPCALCLDQREAHWAGLGVTAAGLVAAMIFHARLGAAAAVGAAALVYAVSAGLAFYHTGVEFRMWPGPPSCTGIANIVDIGEIAGSLTEKAQGPACDQAPWTLFGVSMAGYNLIISAGLFALTMLAAIAEIRLAKTAKRFDSKMRDSTNDQHN